jgi:uncharacterized protein YggU (UPF0235/DUF167 family)
VPRRAVTIVAGEHSRLKRVHVDGLTTEGVDSALRSPTERR